MPEYQVKKCSVCGNIRGCTYELWKEKDKTMYEGRWVCGSCNIRLRKDGGVYDVGKGHTGSISTEYLRKNITE